MLTYGRNQLQQYCNNHSIKRTTFQDQKKKKKDLFLRFFVAVLDSAERVIFLQNILFERKENILLPPKTQGERNGITEQK